MSNSDKQQAGKGSVKSLAAALGKQAKKKADKAEEQQSTTVVTSRRRK